ncbi:MAG: DUF72 domain-containing protein [Pseudonocardiales bacterium]|nr:DUF72 domain-containing protein [Pseudonocardiales bacterium]
MSKILVGTASWTDKSLVQSGWYPSGVSTPADRLRYYADHFPLVEVDSTYYFLPTHENAQRWVERTPASFTFNIKAFSLFTQHPTKPNALPRDLSIETNKRMLYLRDLPASAIERAWDEFINALAPLFDAGKLGVILFQYPPWFVISKKNKQYVLECAQRVAPAKTCIEFRHYSWMRDDNQAETLNFLNGHDLPYVCVDMPQGFSSSLPPVLAATSDLAVVRFHGHNDAEWDTKSVQRRFAYLYSDDELKGWAPKIMTLASAAKTTHVLMNNCYKDYAQRNAAKLSELLHRSPTGQPKIDV